MASVGGGAEGGVDAVAASFDALVAPDGGTGVAATVGLGVVFSATGLDGVCAAAGCGSGPAVESAPQSSSMASVGGGTEASDVAGGCDGILP